MATANSRLRNWILGLLVGLGIPLAAQVIRSPASEFPSVAIETGGSSGAPSLSWIGSTGGLYSFSSTQVGITGDLIPGSDATYNLGGSSNRFKNLYLSGALAVSTFSMGDGSSGAPSLFYTSQTSLGLYKIDATHLGITGGIQTTVAGTAGAPSYAWTTSATTGFYLASAGNIGVSGALLPGATATYALGATGSRWTTGWFSGVLTDAGTLTGDGTAGAPGIAFASTTTLGFYKIGTAIIGATGSILPSVTGTFDIGTSSTPLAWRNGYFTGTVQNALNIVGWPAAIVNAGLFRSEYVNSGGSCCASMVGLTAGDQSVLGDLRLNRIVAGLNGSVTSIGNGSTLWDFTSGNGLTTAPTSGFFGMHLAVSPLWGTNYALPAYAAYAEWSPNASHNFTGTDYTGMYGASYPTGVGTFTEVTGLVGDAEVGGNGAVAAVFGVKAYCCSFAPGSGTASTITHSGFFHAAQPLTSAVPPILHSAIWIEDQTAGGTFVPSGNNYWLQVDTVAGAGKAAIGTATGLLALDGATPTATSPLKVGATMSSTRFDNGNSSTAQTIDLSKGNVQKSTLTGNVTYTLTNPTDSGEYYLELFTGAGSFTATWPASVKWPAGTGPTITVTASRMDLIRLVYDSTSGDYWGSFTQNYSP